MVAITLVFEVCHLSALYADIMDVLGVTERTFTFGDIAVKCMCRRDHEESAGVTLTLQVTVEEVTDHIFCT